MFGIEFTFIESRFVVYNAPARRPLTISASWSGTYRDNSWMVQWLSTASIGRDNRRRIREVVTTTAWRWRCKSKSHCNSWYTKHSRCHNNTWHLLVWRHTELLTSCWTHRPTIPRFNLNILTIPRRRIESIQSQNLDDIRRIQHSWWSISC